MSIISLSNTTHIFIRSRWLPSTKFISSTLPVSLKLLVPSYNAHVVSGLMPYSRLYLHWTRIIDSNFAYHNTVCTFCYVALNTVGMRAHLVSVNLLTSLRIHCKDQHRRTCFRSWITVVWNHGILFSRSCIYQEAYFFFLDCEAIGIAATPGLLCQLRVIVNDSEYDCGEADGM
jgi:hypothetical protein